MILDLDKQKNEESIPLENVAEEEERREILVETINEEEQRAFEHAGDVSDIAHRKLSPQKSLAQEKANGNASIDKRDKPRLAAHQLTECEKQYHITPCITRKTYQELADHMNLPKRKIVIWFQNRRAKEKRLLRAERRTSLFSAQIRQISKPINGDGDVYPPCIRTSDTSTQEYGKIITAKIVLRDN
ncbi:hypothetical protein HN011_004987 [Eciton burchellii]|nr:hypothetical protein HN011_004987 [Eciton burchellii]